MSALRPDAALLALPLAVVAHDAGGAEILASGLCRGAFVAGDGRPDRSRAILDDVRLVLDGPARAVFERRLGPLSTGTLDRALDGAAAVLTGSGWQSRLEFDAIRAARSRGLRCVTFIDHWVNYRQRFERGGEIALPDEVWLGDADGLRLAGQALPGVPARLLPNPYFAEMAEWFSARVAGAAAAVDVAAEPRGLRVLYVCEPVREPARRMHGDERHWGYTEEEALAFTMNTLAGLGESIEAFVLRPHPSEPVDKYDTQLARSPLPTRRGGAMPLLDEVAAADTVIGLNSMAMVIGLLACKRVLCGIPPGGSPCLLPQREIGMLRDLGPGFTAA